MKPSEVWDKAADYLGTYGWLRYYLGADGGPRCASGALMSVPNYERVEAYLAMDELMPDGFMVSLFNDCRVVDQEHAIDWLRASAAEMREAGL